MSERPDFKPGNLAIYWFIRDHCKWPMPAKSVYEALYKRWGTKGIFPSDDLIAKDIGTSPATVKRWRNWLKQHNLLNWKTSFNPKLGNQYQLLPPWNYLGEPVNLAQNDLGQNELAQIERGNLGQIDLAQNDLAHSDLGNLGHSDLLSIKEKEIKNKGGGVGEGNSLPLPPSIWEEQGLDHFLTEMFVLGGAVIKSRRIGIEQYLRSLYAGDVAEAFAALTADVVARAPEVRRPALWLWSQVVIWLCQHPAEFDGTAATFTPVLRKAIAAGRLDTGYPEWLSGEEWKHWQLAIGNGTEAEYAQLVRWYRVLAQSHIQDDAVYDLLCEAQERDVELTDDPGRQRFDLVNLPGELSARMQVFQDAVTAVLEQGYRCERVQDQHGGADHIRRDMLFRLELREAMKTGDRDAVIALAVEEPGWALEVATRRGWMTAYPEMGQVLQTACDAAAAAGS